MPVRVQRLCNGRGRWPKSTASGVGIFNWYYLSSPPQIPRRPGVHMFTSETVTYRVTAISLPKPPTGFRSGLKFPLELLESSRYNTVVFQGGDDERVVFQGGDDERGYRNMCEISQGPNLGT